MMNVASFALLRTPKDERVRKGLENQYLEAPLSRLPRMSQTRVASCNIAGIPISPARPKTLRPLPVTTTGRTTVGGAAAARGTAAARVAAFTRGAPARGTTAREISARRLVLEGTRLTRGTGEQLFGCGIVPKALSIARLLQCFYGTDC